MRSYVLRGVDVSDVLCNNLFGIVSMIKSYKSMSIRGIVLELHGKPIYVWPSNSATRYYTLIATNAASIKQPLMRQSQDLTELMAKAVNMPSWRSVIWMWKSGSDVTEIIFDSSTDQL